MTVSGRVIENGTVVMRDGLIEAVGAGVAVPTDARVIDVKGLTVTPGLVDGFGGIGLPSAADRPPPPRPAPLRRRARSRPRPSPSTASASPTR